MSEANRKEWEERMIRDITADYAAKRRIVEEEMNLLVTTIKSYDFCITQIKFIPSTEIAIRDNRDELKVKLAKTINGLTNLVSEMERNLNIVKTNVVGEIHCEKCTGFDDVKEDLKKFTVEHSDLKIERGDAVDIHVPDAEVVHRYIVLVHKGDFIRWHYAGTVDKELRFTPEAK